MKIGMVCPYSWDVPGGLQSHIRDLAEALIDDFYTMQVEAADRVLRTGGEAKEQVTVWAAARAGALAPVESLARELRAVAIPDLAMLVVASRQLRKTLG